MAINRAGRARNARINQAIKHATEALENLRRLAGFPMHEYLDDKDAWTDARNAIEQLAQCFHEASAYNNMHDARNGLSVENNDAA